jgi:hypothetical protein
VGGVIGGDGAGKFLELGGEVLILDGVEDGAALLGGGDDGGALEQGEVAGDDGEVDTAAGGDFSDATGAGAFGQAGQEEEAGGIAEGLEEDGIEEVIKGAAAGGGAFGSEWMFVYLRHDANIAGDGRDVKRWP